MKSFLLASVSVAVAGLLSSACTVHQTEAPGLTGPSEYALSVSLTASPDSLTQDGQSNSTIAVVARDPNGRPMSNMAFRLDMLVDGQPADYGKISTRNVTTGADGRATAVYTAPPAPPAGSTASGACAGSSPSLSLAGQCVQVVATAIGSNFTGDASHTVLIHLIPTSVIVPASATPTPSFTVAPAVPTANAPAQFDASKSCAGALDSGGQCPASAGVITGWVWSFGDGTSGTGKTPSHTFSREQTFLVTLTITNDRGISASSTQSFAIGAGAAPAPAFTSSPTAPVPGQAVYFDANTSKPGAGHNIVRFVWNWGDGSGVTESNAPTATHTFAAEGTYVVTLNVADEAGQTGTASTSVKVSVTAPAP